MEFDERILSREELEVYNYYLESMKECPKCKTKDKVVTHVFGRPSTSLINLCKKSNRIKLGGCSLNQDSNKFSCEKCETKFN